MEITGAELFVKALKEENVETLFAYPGGQAIDLFHALYGAEGIDIILPRYEQGLVHAADGYARSTGKVGVCLVTSGSGATNLVTGIATANYDSVPLVCFTGQVSTHLIGKDAFQEVDIVVITESITKYAVTVRKREELAETIKKAFYIARSGRPGVVVVDFPKDIQQALGSSDYPKCPKVRDYYCRTEVPSEQIRESLECLNRAEKPVFLLGGGVNIAHAGQEVTALVEQTGIPVVTTIMGKGVIPTSHPLYIGNLGIHGSYASNKAISECDVLFAIGVRFNDRITGKVSEFAKSATIIHVDIDPSSISKNIAADVEIIGDAKEVILELRKMAPVYDFSDWKKQVGLWKREHPLTELQDMQPGVTPLKIIREINQIFEQAVIATDVGQNQMWAAQFLELTQQKQMLTSGGLGTMGYGFPAAIGAKLGNPDKDVIAICGDGGIQMNIQEMATAIVYELPIIICIFNNGYLGNVRQWQEMFFQKRYSCTCLRYRKSCRKICNTPSANCPEYVPDFVRWAESYGAKAIRVKRTEEIREALEEAKNTRSVPTVIEFIIDPELNVLPIVPPGSAINDMIREYGAEGFCGSGGCEGERHRCCFVNVSTI